MRGFSIRDPGAGSDVVGTQRSIAGLKVEEATWRRMWVALRSREQPLADKRNGIGHLSPKTTEITSANILSELEVDSSLSL